VKKVNTDFIKGVVVPIITPIDENELIDEAKMRDQVDYVIDGGVLGILAFGSNGEFYMLEEDEMERGLNIMLDQAKGRVPVYFGIGAISTKKCIRLAQMAKRNGAAGISVLQPMFLKPNEDELYYHFKAIADSVIDLPMLLYNNPGRVGYTLSANLVERLATDCENIVGMKDTSGDITQTSEFIRRTRHLGFKVFGGKDTLLYASMCHGAVGGVCTAANFMPELITDIYNKYVAGDIEGSLEAQFKLNPVRLSMDAGSFPVAAKDMANLRGRNVGKPYRPNLPTPEGKALEGYKKTMKEAGLL
jgi:dihydrodipicolinate synthase